MTLDQLFKLAAIAHFEVQGNGSLGDIATSVFGGWLEYHSFDRQWLKTARHNYSLSELLAKNWPGLKIKSLPVFDRLNLLIGWTGSPASTSNLVDKVELSKEERRKNTWNSCMKAANALNKWKRHFKNMICRAFSNVCAKTATFWKICMKLPASKSKRRH